MKEGTYSAERSGYAGETEFTWTQGRLVEPTRRLVKLRGRFAEPKKRVAGPRERLEG